MDLAVPTEYENALQELRRGRDLVLMLQRLTNQPSSIDGWLVVAGKLVEEVLIALNNPITVFSRAAANIAERKKTVNISTPSSSPGTPDGSRDLNMSDGSKRGRVDICEQIGGRRKRHRQNKWDWTRNPRDEDGFTWKKYGEKDIHGAKHRRMYYKCSQSTDQGCQATKQVQKANDDPSLFAITRIGQHTCQKVIYASDFMHDDSTAKNAFRISFGSSCRPSSSSTISSVDSRWLKGEETQEHLPFPGTTFVGRDSRSHLELQEMPDMYDRYSIEQSSLVPPDSQSPTSCQTSTTDLTDDLRNIYGELLLQEQDWSFFE